MRSISTDDELLVLSKCFQSIYRVMKNLLNENKLLQMHIKNKITKNNIPLKAVIHMTENYFMGLEKNNTNIIISSIHVCI